MNWWRENETKQCFIFHFYLKDVKKCPLYFYEMKSLLHGNTCVEMKPSSVKQPEKV